MPRNSRQLPASPQESRNKTQKSRKPAGIGQPRLSHGPPKALQDAPQGLCGGGSPTEGAFPVSPQSEWTSLLVRRRFPVRLQDWFHNRGDFGSLPRRSPFPSPRWVWMRSLAKLPPPPSPRCGHLGEQTRGLRGLQLPHFIPYPPSRKFAGPELFPGRQKRSQSLHWDQSSCFLRQYPHRTRAASHCLYCNLGCYSRKSPSNTHLYIYINLN